MKNNKRTQGFTLIELLIVIAIIGILAAVLIPNLLGAQKRAYDTGSQACAKSIQTAEATYQIDKQIYFAPSKAANGAATFTANSATISAPDGLSSGCSTAALVISAGTSDVSSYSFTITDTRGKNTYLVTPSLISAQ